MHRLLWIGGAGIALAAPGAAAQDARSSPALTVDGSCPARQSVEAVLSSVLPSLAAGGTVEASVADRGDSYLVSVGDRSKTYPDPDRDCTRRARIAAAFIALVLAPDASSEHPEPPPVSAPAQEAPIPAPRRRGSSNGWVRLDALGAFEVSSPVGLASPGLALEVGAGWGAWGAWAGCSWIEGVTMPLAAPGERARIERFPCALGPAARWRVPPVDVDLKAGIALGALRAAGEGFSTAYDSARLEVGGRLAIDAALHLSPGAFLTPVAGLEATYYPVPYHLFEPPRGVVASTPTLWLGVTAGLRWNAL
jgi:hypothetical protein